jgi:hypothetical protein
VVGPAAAFTVTVTGALSCAMPRDRTSTTWVPFPPW